MPARTAYAGAAVAGEVLTAANVNRLPGGWIGYSETTANQGPFGSADTDLTNLSVAVTVGTSRRIRVSVYAFFQVNNAAGRLHLSLKEGATLLQTSEEDQNLGGYITFAVSVVLTPTAGSHTYKAVGGSSAGTTMTLSATTSNPAYILVEDLGPAT